MVNIKRKVAFNVLFIIIFVFILNLVLINAEELKVFDDANLFTEEEITKLGEEANIISNNYDMDIVIVTTNDANGKTSREYADDYFDYNGFGVGNDSDGILFLIDMDNREAYISTSGIGIRYLTDERIENIIEGVLNSGLGDGDYYGGAMAFLSGTKGFLERGIPSDQYSEDESVKEENSLTFLEGIISLASGGVVSAGFFFRTKSKYKMKNPVKPLTFRENSIMNLVSQEEILLDTVTTHRIIPKASSNNSTSGKSTTHTSSSGKTHGGGGGKF